VSGVRESCNTGNVWFCCRELQDFSEDIQKRVGIELTATSPLRDAFWHPIDAGPPPRRFFAIPWPVVAHE